MTSIDPAASAGRASPSPQLLVPSTRHIRFNEGSAADSRVPPSSTISPLSASSFFFHPYVELKKHRCSISKFVSSTSRRVRSVGNTPEVSPSVPSPKMRLPGSSKPSKRERRDAANVEGTIIRAVPSAKLSVPTPSPKVFGFLRSRPHTPTLRDVFESQQISITVLRGDDLEQYRRTTAAMEKEIPAMKSPALSDGYLGVWKDGKIHYVQEAVQTVEATGPVETITTDTNPQQPDTSEPAEEPTPIYTKPQRPKIKVRIPKTCYTVLPMLVQTSAQSPDRKLLFRVSDSPMSSSSSRMTSAQSSKHISIISPLSPETGKRRYFAPYFSSIFNNGSNDTHTSTSYLVPIVEPSPAPLAAPLDQPSSASGSSDKTENEADERSLSSYSRRSSFSSVYSNPPENARKTHRHSYSESAAYLAKSPASARVSNEDLQVPGPIKSSTKNSRSRSWSNMAKPLPPSPQSTAHLSPEPLRVGGRTCSRYLSPSLKPPRAKSPSGLPLRAPSPDPLRSKFSAAELDHIDYVFLKASPKLNCDMDSFAAAADALETTIKDLDRRTEDKDIEPLDLDVPSVDAPLQISRGPMEMVPSRPPPATQTKQKGDKKRRMYHSMSHITSQLKPPVANNAVRHASSAEFKLPKEMKADLEAAEISKSSHTQKHDVAVQTEIISGMQPVEKKPTGLQDLPELAVGKVVDEHPCSPALPQTTAIIQPYALSAPKDIQRNSAVSRTFSVKSLATSDITQWYLDMPPSAVECVEPRGTDSAVTTVPISAAEAIVLHIFLSIDNLQDIFSLAQSGRGFYIVFKKNELRLIKHALWGMSPAAWELREVCPPFERDEDLNMDKPVPEYTPTSYLRNHTRDLYTMVALKSLILVRCKSLLRPETVSALSGEDDKRSSQLDDAFYRVWTFCKLFGSNKNREDDIVGQIDWLNGGALAHEEKCSASMSFIGESPDPCVSPTSCFLNPPEAFGKGNGKGLSRSQLWDMMEIWTCLGVLLKGFHGRSQIARQYGVFGPPELAKADVETMEWLLEEWIFYLLSLGPSVILDLATPSEQSGPAGFELAAENGWTVWSAPPSGGSRSTFLKEAVRRVYDERMAVEKLNDVSNSAAKLVAEENARRRRMKHIAELRARRQNSRPDVAELPGCSPKTPTSPPRKGGERHHQQYHQQYHQQSPPSCPPRGRPQHSYAAPAAHPRHYVHHLAAAANDIKYPLDRAVFQMVGMGFTAAEAKRALAETDTNDRLDVQAAVELLLNRRALHAAVEALTVVGAC